MRIAFVTREFVTEPKFDGGLANYLNRVTRALHAAGHEPEVFVVSDRSETIDHGGVPVHRVAAMPGRTEQRFVKLFRRVARACPMLVLDPLRESWQVARAVKARHAVAPFDLVQAPDYGATGLMLPKSAQLPVIVRLSWYAPFWREASGTPTTRVARMRDWIERCAMRRAAACYAPSSFIARRVQELTGIKIDVMHPPVFQPDAQTHDEAAWREHLAGKRYVLFFGRICRIKGTDVLLDAMQPLLRQHADLYLALVGRDELSGRLDAVRQALGDAAGRLVHLNRLPHDQLYPIIRGAAVVALPSRVDNFPNTCIEAMLAERVVVASRDAGFDDLIDDGENGFLAERENAADFTSKIEAALKLPDDAARALGERAHSSLDRFAADRTIAELTDYFERQIAARRPHARRNNHANERVLAVEEVGS